MKDALHDVLDESDERVAMLMSIGVHKHLAVLMVYLSDEGTGDSLKICHDTILRQPYVTKSAQAGKKLGWIHYEKAKASPGARARNVYSLAIPFDNILDSITQAAAERAQETAEGVAAARRLLNGLQ